MSLGTAISSKFLLGTATVMIGPQNNAFDLDPTDNGIGLVKNFSCTSVPTYTELTQGITNSRVASVMTGIDVKATMEVFEYTAKNLTFGLALDGSAVVTQTKTSTTTVAIAGTPAVPVTSVTVTDGTQFAVNQWIMLSDGDTGNIAVTQVTVIALDVLTVSPGIGQSIASGATVNVVNMVDVGSRVTQPYLSAKVVGELGDGSYATLILPKVRIVKGFTLAFMTNAFGNLPYELEVYDLTPSDTLYSQFSDRKAALFLQ